MDLPDAASFFREVRAEFQFLTDAGFRECRAETSSLTAQIGFSGKHVTVSLSMDRRDQCIDFYVTQVLNGKLARNDVPGGYWSHFHAFLVDRRKYRGSLREFMKDLDPKSWRDQIRADARALRALAPEIVADAEGCLDPA